MIITTKDGKKYNVAAKKENMSDEEKATETNSEKKEEQEEKTLPVLQFCKKHGKDIIWWATIAVGTALGVFIITHANQDEGAEATEKLLSACNRKALPEESHVINEFAASDIFLEPDEIQENILEMIDATDAVARTHAPHTTNMHLRTLPEGWTASPKKKAEALEYGIHLEKGQTLVDSYQTGRTA